MSGLFDGGSKPVEVAPPKPAPPVPTAETAAEAGDIARKRRPRGFRDTFLTGELTPDTGKKKRLA